MVRLVQGELVLWGGDKSDVATCVVAESEWKWVTPRIVGVAPAPRSFAAAAVLRGFSVVYFGGMGLMDNTELNDVVMLARTDGGWEWRA